MPDTPGTSRLTDDQADWYEDKFGERYSHVPDRAPTFRDGDGQVYVRANRKQRRAKRRKGGK